MRKKNGHSLVDTRNIAVQHHGPGLFCNHYLPEMIRGSRLTAHDVIVSEATSALLVSSGIVHRHLE